VKNYVSKDISSSRSCSTHSSKNSLSESNKTYGKDLVEALQEICKPGKVSEVKITLGCDGIDSFISLLNCIEVRVIQDGVETVQKFLQKKMRKPDNLFLKEIIGKSGIFQRESDAYRSVFRAMNNFQCDKDSNFIGLSICNFYTSWIDGHGDYILLEDARQRGFVPAENKVGLSNAEIWFALKELAKFHAISFAMALDEVKKIEEIFPSIKYPKEFLDSKEEKQIHSIHFRAATDMLARTGNGALAEKLASKFKNKEVETGQNMLKYNGPFRVLCHGDFWTDNLLFKYNDSKKPVQMLMVDFQWLKPMSAVFDFGYFIYTSTRKKQRQDFLNDWSELYFGHFKETVKSFNVDFPESLTLDLFKEELRNSMPYFILHMSFALAVQNCTDSPSIAEFDLSNAPTTLAKEIQQQAKKRMASKNVQDALVNFYVEMDENKFI